MKAIADTGFIVAMARENDHHHRWAAEVGEQVDWPALTCEAVLAEAAFHLDSGLQVLRLLRDNIVQVGFDCDHELDHCMFLPHATRIAT